MLDFSFGEIALVVFVALVVVGPKNLPAVMHTLGRWFGQFKGIADEFRAGFKEAMKDTELKSFEDDMRSISEEIKYIKDQDGNFQRVYDVSEVMRETKTAGTLPPKP